MAERAGFNPETAPTSAASASAEPPASGCIAAVDLGSNTFHLLVARIDAGEPRIIQRLKFRTRLAAGLGEDGRLSDEALERATEALRRIADRLGGIAPERIRAVGTSTLRALEDPAPFLDRAAAILGVPVEIIDGTEEARLIFAGASESLPRRDGPRLVVDIGGGSTELALGRGHAAERTCSLETGCVGLSRIALREGPEGATVMARALEAATAGLDRAEIDALLPPDTEVVGTSGSFEAVAAALAARGWHDGGVTRVAVRRLVEALAGEPVLPAPQPGVDPDREEVFHGGLALLLAIMERVGIERMRWADGALEDGLLRRIVPLPERGLRSVTLEALETRFVVDRDGAERVRELIRTLMQRHRTALRIPVDDLEVLEAGARLHDIGMTVNARHHERHGAWLLRNAELRGFEAEERELLMHLVRAHRGPWPRLALSALPPALQPRAARLGVLMRLAVILGPVGVEALPPIRVEAEQLCLAPDADWCRAHPWTLERLRTECGLLAEAGVRPGGLLEGL
jgi:exopolyphosphatase/guanosine-5'-triphosphate,3'-diphosphate pyrophosphatase